MDLISLYYFSELAKDMHMTRTANRLFISQQTLSNHIKRLEEELDCELLERKPNLRLTYAGEAALAFANRITNEYTNLKDVLTDITEKEHGILRVGGSDLKLSFCMARILPKFSAVYPNVEFRLTEANSSELEPLVLSGEIDFAIMVSVDESPNLIIHDLADEPAYLCVADSLLKKHYGKDIQNLKEQAMHGATVEQFAKLPFCLNNSRLGRIATRCFEDAGISPNVYAVSKGAHISFSLCTQRSAACITSQMRLDANRDSIPSDINIFPFFADGAPVTQPLRIVYRKDRYISRYASHFLGLLSQYFAGMGDMRMEHMA